VHMRVSCEQPFETLKGSYVLVRRTVSRKASNYPSPGENILAMRQSAEKVSTFFPIIFRISWPESSNWWVPRFVDPKWVAHVKNSEFAQ